MAYVYLLDLHDYIDGRLTEAGDVLAELDGDPEQTIFQKGRIDMLTKFKEFLTENLNPKLPRAIRRRLQDQG